MDTSIIKKFKKLFWIFKLVKTCIFIGYGEKIACELTIIGAWVEYIGGGAFIITGCWYGCGCTGYVVGFLSYFFKKK